MKTSRHYVLAVLVGVVLGTAVFTLVYARTKRVKQAPPPQKELVTSAPEVVSCVKNIKVISTTIKNPGPVATVAVEVENTSDLAVIAIEVETTKGKETYGVVESTFEADEPTAVIEPRATHILTVAAANLYPRVPLQIGSVMYADGTEDGCAASIKRMRDSKATHEARKAERKGRPQ